MPRQCREPNTQPTQAGCAPSPFASTSDALMHPGDSTPSFHPLPLPSMPDPKGTSAGMQHSIPLPLCPCNPKTCGRQLAAPSHTEKEEEEGVAARPHPSWGHSARRGHLRLAAVIVTEHNGLAASAPKPAQSAPRGALAITAQRKPSWGCGVGRRD